VETVPDSLAAKRTAGARARPLEMSAVLKESQAAARPLLEELSCLSLSSLQSLPASCSALVLAASAALCMRSSVALPRMEALRRKDPQLSRLSLHPSIKKLESGEGFELKRCLSTLFLDDLFCTTLTLRCFRFDMPSLFLSYN